MDKTQPQDQSKSIRKVKKERMNPSFCHEEQDFMKFKNSNIFAYLFCMLFYSVLIYYGFTIILVNYLKNMIALYRILLIITIMLALILVFLLIISFKYGKFSFMYYILKVMLGTIIGNIGVVWFLSRSFSLTYMEILNLFAYMLLVSVGVSIIAYFVVKLLIKVRCRE